MHIWYTYIEVKNVAELCPKCLNKLDGTHYPDWWYILSDEVDFCEECRQWKRVVIVERRVYYRRKIRNFLKQKNR